MMFVAKNEPFSIRGFFKMVGEMSPDHAPDSKMAK